MKRTVEVYTGAYTSGKSEIAVNRALFLNKTKPMTLVDLDTVEPVYTMRPIKKTLTEMGLKVVVREDYEGLGEAGNVITGEQQNCLLKDGDMVIDVGYGAGGLDILDIVTNIEKENDIKIYIVINTSKPETFSVENIIEYVKWSSGLKKDNWKKLTGIISNAHFGDDTTLEDVLRGHNIIKKAAVELNLPIIAIGMEAQIYKDFNQTEYDNIPIWCLNRIMPKAFW